MNKQIEINETLVLKAAGLIGIYDLEPREVTVVFDDPSETINIRRDDTGEILVDWAY